MLTLTVIFKRPLRVIFLIIDLITYFCKFLLFNINFAYEGIIISQFGECTGIKGLYSTDAQILDYVAEILIWNCIIRDSSKSEVKLFPFAKETC